MTNTRVVGVSYEAGDAAPIVIVKGSGSAADAVLKNAMEEGATPVVRDPTLVEQLYRVPIDAAIGSELFPVMAALLAHVLDVDRRFEEGRP